MLRATFISVIVIAAGSAMAAESIVIDGSSTVYPISIAAAEAYNAKTGVQFEVSVSGTTGGMRLFTTGKIPIAGASRPIRAEELNACATLGLEFVELPIALDGLTIAVSAQNTFIDALSMADLKKLWEPTSEVKSWSQIRATWPDAPVALFGASKENGTFDYFTEVVNGKSRAIRENYTATVDPNVQVQGLVGNTNALGFFGWSYYQQNSTLLKAVAIDNGHGPVVPTKERIVDGSYAPFSRPLFLYVAKTALDRPEIRGYLEGILDSPKIIEDSGYVPLNADLLTVVRKRLADRITGTLFANLSGHPRLNDIYRVTRTAKAAPTVTPAAPAPAPTPTPLTAPVTAKEPVKAAPAKPEAAPAKPMVAVVPEPAKPATPVATEPAKPATPVATEPAKPVIAVAVEPAKPAAPALAPVDLERIRAASFALARATLEKTPDVAEIRRRSQVVRELLDATVAGVTP